MKAASFAVFFFLMAACQPSLAQHTFKEKDYQLAWCAQIGGQAEVRLADGTRVDCLTDEFAIEVDFAPKWAEAIGQSLYYAKLTGRRPGILLIMEKPGDARYRQRLEQLQPDLKFHLWETTPESIRH
jgi:hypothetical protein